MLSTLKNYSNGKLVNLSLNIIQSLKFFSTKLANKPFKPTPNRVLFKKFSYKSFYKRAEPKLGINFLSDQSKTLLKECLIDNTSNPFFEIIDQYKVQDFPSFCGLTNLTITLNALKIDPKIKWKGIWRWYDEYNTKCINIDNVFDYGMTLAEFQQILKCNNVESNMYRPIIDENKTSNLDLISSGKILTDDLNENKYSCIRHVKDCKNKNDRFVKYSLSNFSFFKAATLSSAIYNNFILMTSLSRKKLNQTGDGHFAPIVSFHRKSNFGLLLEVAKFKYDSRWYHIKDIYNALFNLDTFTNKSRGFFIIKKNNLRKKVPIDINQCKNLAKQKINFNPTINELDKAKLINWLVINEFDYKGNKMLIQNIFAEKLFKLYKNNAKFKELINFIYMYDPEKYIINTLGILIYYFKIKN